MRRILLLLFMALAVVLPTFGQQNTVNAAIDATELLVGEQTVLHTTVNCNAGARVKFEGKKGNCRDLSSRHAATQQRQALADHTQLHLDIVRQCTLSFARHRSRN